MKVAILMAAVATATLFYAPSAHAQLDNNTQICDASMSTCDTGLSNPWSGWFTGGGQQQDCSKIINNSCKSCKSVCDCQYNNAVSKCDGQTCKDNALVDRNACYGNCYIDYSDVC